MDLEVDMANTISHCRVLLFFVSILERKVPVKDVINNSQTLAKNMKS